MGKLTKLPKVIKQVREKGTGKISSTSGEK